MRETLIADSRRIELDGEVVSSVIAVAERHLKHKQEQPPQPSAATGDK